MTGCKCLLRILTVAVLPLLSACADNHFEVTGHFPGTGGSAILHYSDLEGGSWRDTTVFKNGTFKFKGTVDDVYNAQVFIQQDGGPVFSTFFILEPGKIGIDMELDTEEVPDESGNISCKSVVSGTKNNVFYNELNEATAAAGSYEEMLEAMLECIRRHKDCEYAGFLYGIYFSGRPLGEFTEEFESFSESVKSSHLTKGIRRDIEYRNITAPGKEAPAFTLKDTCGNDLSLASLRGQYVILDFWASWCKPCRQGMPAMKELYGKYHDKGLEILGISQDTDYQSWQKAVSEDNTGWIQLIDEAGDDGNTMKVGSAYGVSAIPDYFLIDPEGRFVGNFDHDALEEKLSEYLAIPRDR